MCAWRPLVKRVSGWTRDAYVPLRVMLHPQEGEAWAQTLDAQAPCRSVVAGYVLKDKRDRLSKFSGLLEVTEDEVVMIPQFPTVDERSWAFQEMEAELKAEGAFPLWQDELYAARISFASPTMFSYHRGVGHYFGLSQFGTHLNGYICDKDTGGGLPARSSALDNMVKEAEEEAGLVPSQTRSRFVAAGSIPYVVDHPLGLVNDTMLIYDVELPKNVVPENQDGEVERFDLYPVQDALKLLLSDSERFKPDVCLVLLDFFVRHGVLTADNFPDYEELQRILHCSKSPYEALNKSDSSSS